LHKALEEAPRPTQLNYAELVRAQLPDEPPVSMLRDLVAQASRRQHLGAPERMIVERGLMHAQRQTGVLS
jgi:hypothetical protein